MSTAPSGPDQGREQAFDVVVVGAGFAGLYMLHRLRGLGFSARVYEQGGDVGGTWYWNRYPGARCDIESMQYSYSFSEELQQEWDWSERYASQPEILRIRQPRRRSVRPAPATSRSTPASNAPSSMRRPAHGASTIPTAVRCSICRAGDRCLSNARMPDIKGLSDFKGPVYHTGQWPHEEVDFTGKRVGVIGTGSSAIQSVPLIARRHVSFLFSSARRIFRSRPAMRR